MNSWEELFNEVDVRGALPIQFRMSDPNAIGGECVSLFMTVPCIHTGQEIQVRKTISLPSWESLNQAMLFVYNQALEFYRHELQEQFYLGIERPFDPAWEHV